MRKVEAHSATVTGLLYNREGGMLSRYLLSMKRNWIALNSNDNPVMLLLETESLQGSVVEFRSSASFFMTFFYIWNIPMIIQVAMTNYSR